MLDWLTNLPPALLSTLTVAHAVGENALVALVIVLVIAIRRLKARLSAFFAGKNGKDLESVLEEQLRETKVLDTEIQELYEISNRLRELVLKSVHKVSVLRFNPFKEVGGNQSFSVALLDGKNSGVVLSSLHTREGTRVYAKPVISGEAAAFPFTEEEKSAIRQAAASAAGKIA